MQDKQNMKKAVITIWLIFIIVIVFAGNPPEGENEKSKSNNSLFSPSNLPSNSNYRKNYIYPEWGFFVDASPGISFINNNNLSSEIWKSKGDLGYSFNVGYFHSLNSSFKIKTGLGVSGYKNTLQGNGNIPPQIFTDVDNDPYTENLILTNVENNSSPTYLSIPAIFEYGQTNINKTGFYVNIGFMYSFLFNDSFKPGGSYTTTAYYDQWGLTLENIEELGLYTEKNLESNGTFRKNNLSVLGGVGITVPISSVVIFKAGFVGNLGLTDIGNNQPVQTDSDPLSAEAFEFRSRYVNNSLAVTKGTKTRQIGFEFGLYINKRLK